MQFENLTPDQQQATLTLRENCYGLKVLTGGPGSGKTHLTRYLAQENARSGIKVVLSASTGAAAARLSKFAGTNHSTFGIPVNGFLQHLSPTNPMRKVLEEATVFFCDEFSMLTSSGLNSILTQLMRIKEFSTIAQLLEKVLVVLVGDHAQLPPVCRHNLTAELTL
jgi:ATP-dependent exoDNAse (exonuclease V) alpha subunit